MKAMLSWLGDPCIHLAIIALFIFRLFIASSGPPEPAGPDLPLQDCYVCGKAHQEGQLCPLRAQSDEPALAIH